jgi:diacylglycerol kinase family enzyme
MFSEALGNGNDGSSSKECHAADELMRKRGPENYRKATEEYKALLEKEPDRCVCVGGGGDGMVGEVWSSPVELFLRSKNDPGWYVA